MARLRSCLVICALLASPAAAWGQPGAPVPGGRQGNRPAPARGGSAGEAVRGTSIMRGIVVAADNGSPVRRAQVRVSAQGAGTRVATTDTQGRFEVRDLPAGRYTLSAAKAGFVSLQYGQRRPSEAGTPIEVGDRQLVDKLVVALPRGSVISGRISDEYGEPVANAMVSAMRYGYVGGAKRLMPAPGQNGRDTTDDQGQFRLFGIPPGEYIVSATLRTAGGDSNDPDAENTGYAPTYYPGTPNIGDAQRVAVALAQEQSGVAFSLVATRLVRVSGTVLNSQGAPIGAGMVTLTPVTARLGTGALGQSVGGRIDQTGQFRIANVPPGRYIAQARSMTGRGPGGRGGGGAISEVGRQEIAVGGDDLSGVVVVTAPGGRITGQVVTAPGALAELRPQQVTVTARTPDPEAAMPGGNGGGRVNDDWTFEITNVFDARLFRVNLPSGWYLKAITLNGQDVTDTPVDVPPGQTLAGLQIVLTDKSAEVSGRVVDARGNAVTDVTVIVFPADEARWMFQSRFVRTARPDLTGRYEIRGLPASKDYLAVAVQGLEDGQAGDPEFLASVRDAAASFGLDEGQARVLDLRWATAQK